MLLRFLLLRFLLPTFCKEVGAQIPRLTGVWMLRPDLDCTSGASSSSLQAAFPKSPCDVRAHGLETLTPISRRHSLSSKFRVNFMIHGHFLYFLNK